MLIQQAGLAGTLESSDIMITLEPNGGGGVEIQLTSTVEKQFGRQIREVIGETLRDLGVDSVRATAVDKGALSCTVRARVRAAAYRAASQNDYRWGEAGG